MKLQVKFLLALLLFAAMASCNKTDDPEPSAKSLLIGRWINLTQRFNHCDGYEVGAYDIEEYKSNGQFINNNGSSGACTAVEKQSKSAMYILSANGRTLT